jgi:hypothetical protein
MTDQTADLYLSDTQVECGLEFLDLRDCLLLAPFQLIVQCTEVDHDWFFLTPFQFTVNNHHISYPGNFYS